MPEDFWGNAVFSVTPTLVIGLVFWFVLRSIIRADRSERRVYAQIEAEERAKLGLRGPAPAPDAAAAPGEATEGSAPGAPASDRPAATGSR